jgi:hypothetical protein
VKTGGESRAKQSRAERSRGEEKEKRVPSILLVGMENVAPVAENSLLSLKEI